MQLSAVILTLAAVGLATTAAFVFGLWAFPEAFLKDARGHATSLRHGVPKAVLGRAAPYNERFLNDDRRTNLQRRFVMAGRTDLRPVDFITYLELSTLFFGGLGVALVMMLEVSWVWALPAVALGPLYPLIWMNDQIKKRQLEITRALPYNLDLLTLAVEAGLDFGSALATVVQRGRAGPLNEELGLLLNEIRMGKTREEGLRNLSDRVGLAPLQQFVSNLIQADKMGTSLGKVLRIQSGQMRIERSQRAEQLANEAPIKLLFPLIGCIFPTVFLVLFGPIGYQLSMSGL